MSKGPCKTYQECWEEYQKYSGFAEGYEKLLPQYFEKSAPEIIKRGRVVPKDVISVRKEENKKRLNEILSSDVVKKVLSNPYLKGTGIVNMVNDYSNRVQKSPIGMAIPSLSEMEPLVKFAEKHYDSKNIILDAVSTPFLTAKAYKNMRQLQNQYPYLRQEGDKIERKYETQKKRRNRRSRR